MTRKGLAAAISAVLSVGLALARGTALVSDLSVTVTDGAATYTAGGSVTYTIVVGNAGPDGAVGAHVSDAVRALAQVESASWTCVGTGGATCTAGPVSGDIVDTVDLPVGGAATYTLVVKPACGASGDLVNTATVTPPPGTTDPGLGPGTATDTDTATTVVLVAKEGGIDSGTCGASATPCKTIKAAIDNAKADEAVAVSAGTYNECVVVAPQIVLCGIRGAANAFVVVLDGAGKCDGKSLEAPAGPVAEVHDKSTLRGFAITNGGDSGVRGLGAVTIANNKISGNTTSSTGGGIRLITGVNLTDGGKKAEISANTIIDNRSGGRGAGIYVEATAECVEGHCVDSVVEIDGNTVTTNKPTDDAAGVSGSGIAVFSDTLSATVSSSVVVTRNTLDGNVAKNETCSAPCTPAIAEGGGLYVATGLASGLGTETVTIGGSKRGNVLRNNVSEGLGGGMSIKVQPAPGGRHTVDVVANEATANTGERGGGGAHLSVRALDRVAGATPDVVLRASGNTFVGNHALGDLSDPDAAGGGGMYTELYSARTVASAVLCEISGNTIERNDAATHGGGASLLAWADGAAAPTDAVISFHNNLVAKNAARDTTAGVPSGGGVYGRAVALGADGHARLSQSFLTVADNETELGTGGLQWEDRLPSGSTRFAGATTVFELSNSIVTGNDGYGVGYTEPLDPATTVTVAYTDAFGNGSGNYEDQLGDPTGTNGNFSEDAKLDGLDARYAAPLCSATIDRGPEIVSTSGELQPNGGYFNLGHTGDTASATQTFPDVTGDDTVDGLDVLGIAVSFNSCRSDKPCSDHARYLAAADRDFDGIVDGQDLAYVSAFYAQSCP